MRLCVSCGIPNTKVKFIGIRCEDCFKLNPDEIEYALPPVSEKKHSSVIDFEARRDKALAKRVEQYIPKIRQCKTCFNEVNGTGRKYCLDCKKKKDDEYKIAIQERKIAAKERKAVKIKEKKVSKINTCRDCATTLGRPKIRFCGNCRAIRLKASRKLTLRKYKESAAERYIALPDTKVCSKCLEEKRISGFYLLPSGAPYSKCKKCHAKLTSKWKEQHREEYLEYHKKYNKIYEKEYRTNFRKLGKKKRNPIPLQLRLKDTND